MKKVKSDKPGGSNAPPPCAAEASDVKVEQREKEQIKVEPRMEDVKMEEDHPIASSPKVEPEWEEVPLTYEEEIEAVFHEEGVIDADCEDPGDEVAKYISLEEELQSTDYDCEARADLGEKALQDLINEVEQIHAQAIRELRPLSTEQKYPGVFMLMKVISWSSSADL